MGYMLFNGNKLPVLPVWDKTTRPYAFMYKSTGFVNSVNLYICETIEYESTASGYGLVAPAGSLNCYVGISGNAAISDSWSELSEKTTDSKMGSHANVCWANFDVLNDDGSVFLAASDPVPVGKPITDPLSFTMGYNWMMAMLAKRGAKKEPVAYLYNGGVQLPALPEVDGYGNKVLFLSNIGSRYKLALCADAMYYDVSNEKIKCPVESDLYFSTYYEDSGWTEPNLYTGYKNGNIASSPPIWVNTDMFDSDGNLYLAASEPVPVYE